MYVKVEPTGCSERRGMVQVRFSMYLEPGDYGYNKYYIQEPIFPKEGYQGKVDENNFPIDLEDYNKWVKSLPANWVNTPFHNHFIRVSADTSNEEIMDIGEAFLHEAYIKWATDSAIDLVNENEVHPLIITELDKILLSSKIQSLKTMPLERKINDSY